MPRKTHHSLVILLTLLTGAFASANVTVKRDQPDIQRKTFDPAKPPAEMPHLNPGEDAVTATSFRIQAGANYEPVTRKKGDDGWTTVIAVHGITITLQLHVTIWVPQGVSEKLKAHEEGHRKISEQVYKDRSLVEAKAAGAIADGKQFTGQGTNWKDAAGNAINPPINELGQAYLHNTADVQEEVSNIYDEITKHGTTDKPEDDAIKEALEKYKANHAAATEPSAAPPAK